MHESGILGANTTTESVRPSPGVGVGSCRTAVRGLRKRIIRDLLIRAYSWNSGSKSDVGTPIKLPFEGSIYLEMRSPMSLITLEFRTRYNNEQFMSIVKSIVMQKRYESVTR